MCASTSPASPSPDTSPKPGYVADWPDLPDWQKETDADIFEAIEDASGQAPK